jgi:hypothetical protein
MKYNFKNMILFVKNRPEGMSKKEAIDFYLNTMDQHIDAVYSPKHKTSNIKQTAANVKMLRNRVMTRIAND